jgi:hypothetical protein
MRRVVDGPLASPAGVGQIFPFVFGVVKRVPGIPLRTPAQASLRLPVGTADSTFYLDSVDALNKFPETGRGTIGGERVSWVARDFPNVALVGVFRHIEGSPSASHSTGEPLYELMAVDQVYGFFENKSGFVHQAITAIYVNGLYKPNSVPPSTAIAIEDLSAIHDHITGLPLNVGTAHFDISNPLADTSPYLAPESVSALQAWLDRNQAGGA